jgi:hypothetical protein
LEDLSLGTQIKFDRRRYDLLFYNDILNRINGVPEENP